MPCWMRGWQHFTMGVFDSEGAVFTPSQAVVYGFILGLRYLGREKATVEEMASGLGLPIETVDQLTDELTAMGMFDVYMFPHGFSDN